MRPAKCTAAPSPPTRLWMGSTGSGTATWKSVSTRTGVYTSASGAQSK